jgi:predicted enzyme related to lactoylglutathione lyase
MLQLMASRAPRKGTIAWVDLTVRDAGRVRDFYREVVGWQPSGVDLGGYEDYNMIPPGARKPAAGVCHRRGPNARLPPAWMVYIVVDNLAKSVARAKRLRGRVVSGPRGTRRTCVLRDPAGAVFTLYQPPAAARK